MGALDDPARLAVLERTGLLDRPVDQRLQRLTRSAIRALGCDAAQINLLDADLQHHVAATPPAPTRTEPAGLSGCRLVVLADNVIAIDDTSQDQLVCDLPWTETYRGYLGAPVRADRQPLGAFCALSLTPRRWTRTDRRLLTDLATLAGLSLT